MCSSSNYSDGTAGLFSLGWTDRWWVVPFCASSIMVHAYTTMRAFTLCLEAKSCLLMLQLVEAYTPCILTQNKYHHKESAFLKRRVLPFRRSLETQFVQDSLITALGFRRVDFGLFLFDDTIPKWWWYSSMIFFTKLMSLNPSSYTNHWAEHWGGLCDENVNHQSKYFLRVTRTLLTCCCDS